MSNHRNQIITWDFGFLGLEFLEQLSNCHWLSQEILTNSILSDPFRTTGKEERS
jgi:hypothetical protein